MNLTKIHKATSKNPTCKSLEYAIITGDGMLLATTGKILVMHDLSFWQENCENAKGKLIKRNVLKQLSKKDVARIVFLENKIIALDITECVVYMSFYSAVLKKDSKLIFNPINPITGEVSEDKKDELKYPNVYGILPDKQNASFFARFGVNPALLKKLKDSICYYKECHLEMVFNETDRNNTDFPKNAIFCYPTSKDIRDRSWGVIMPNVL